jgi:hypothetical protein
MQRAHDNLPLSPAATGAAVACAAGNLANASSPGMANRTASQPIRRGVTR